MWFDGKRGECVFGIQLASLELLELDLLTPFGEASIMCILIQCFGSVHLINYTGRGYEISSLLTEFGVGAQK